MLIHKVINYYGNYILLTFIKLKRFESVFTLKKVEFHVEPLKFLGNFVEKKAHFDIV